MYELMATFGAIILGLLSLILLTVLFSAFTSGPGEVSYLSRKNYGLRAWASGSLQKPARGATMRELEGIELKSSGGRLNYARRTRAPSSELL